MTNQNTKDIPGYTLKYLFDNQEVKEYLVLGAIERIKRYV
jgi:hypothetical protein